MRLQNNIQIKFMEIWGNFWNISKENYPNIRKWTMYLTGFLGSTCFWGSIFSHIKYIITKYQSKLSDEHLYICLRLTITTYIYLESTFSNYWTNTACLCVCILLFLSLLESLYSNGRRLWMNSRLVDSISVTVEKVDHIS